MNQIAGNYLGDKPKGNILDDVVRRVPVLAEKKLTPYQGLLHAIWTDGLRSTCGLYHHAQHRPHPREYRRRPPVRTGQ